MARFFISPPHNGLTETLIKMLKMFAMLHSSKPHPGALQTLLWKRHPFSKRLTEGPGFQWHPPPPPAGRAGLPRAHQQPGDKGAPISQGDLAERLFKQVAKPVDVS